MYKERFGPNIIDKLTKIKYIKASGRIRPCVISGINVGRNFSSARVSNTNVEKQFPEFKGKLVKRGNTFDVDYEAQCYQYASSSYFEKGIIRPAAIIKAADDSDVIKAINYARNNEIAVAVRTGGHQYCGASSTSGKNIQLDLSQTYKDFEWDENSTSVTCGVSFSLGEFNAKLREKQRFIPHGQCQYVNIGGHVQTGGYGQLGRSFGLFSDYVKKFRIITADGQPHWVCKNKDKDLFFAVLGGSPGNFGVLTHVTLDVFRDQDYPNSRGFRAVYPYDRQRFKALLDVMVKMAEDEDFPADYDYCVTMMDESPFMTDKINYDALYDRGPSVTWPPMIIVFAQWANLQGNQQNYDSEFIDKIRQVAGKGIVQISDEKHIPMSTLTGHWTFPITREFKFPYIKRVYSSNSSSKRLKDFKWTDWVADRIEDGNRQRNVNLATQFQHFGGSNSRFYQNGRDNSTSFSWRDARLVVTLDAFYHSYLRIHDYLHKNLHKKAEAIKVKHEEDEATKWVQENDKGVGNPEATFCEHDRRVLWGSHDLDLSAAQQYYYDQHPKGKYERLCQIKRNYDPSGVFTPNRFCIGLPVSKEEVSVDSQDKVQPKIKLTDSETAKEEITATEEPQLSAEDKFWKMAKMKREVGKPVPLWDIWDA